MHLRVMRHPRFILDPRIMPQPVVRRKTESEIGVIRAHDMVCTSKGSDVTSPLEVSECRPVSPQSGEGSEDGQDAAEIRKEFRARLGRIVGNRARLVPTACLGAPSSRSWKPSQGAG